MSTKSGSVMVEIDLHAMPGPFAGSCNLSKSLQRDTLLRML
jgi:hypothetical protein